ncbi:MAG: hypothetical protein FLDDKLPJ_00295 [Phycisphaerae bacterium]|nr:hypothetical protein [Phycisphaerae bacterium]
MRLSREIRAYLTASGAPDGGNGWAGRPVSDRLDPFVVIRATLDGPVRADTGFVCNITEVDRVLRGEVLERLRSTRRDDGPVAPPLIELARAAAERFPAPLRLVELELSPSPYTRYRWVAGASGMIYVTQSFEFSASHRLHSPRLSESENLAVFGKCANPSGHGHNYVLEATVCGAPDAHGRVVDLSRLDRSVRERVIDAFDHKHLNLDCPEFAALNPTVENIARVIWDKLAGALPATLHKVRLYETPKTFAEYAGEDG